MTVHTSEFASMMAPVAAELLGEPNYQKSTKTEWRYGTHGSLSVDLSNGVWSDHEAKTGGGVVDLVQLKLGVDKPAALAWLRERGLPETTQQRREVARYTYIDENGEVLFDVVRFDPKDFRQQAADKSWSTKGIRRVLYRLPELLASDASEPVYIVEGEKDVDRLRGLGLVATCNVGGAGKWRYDYSASLKGRTCVILPDNDEAGREHADAVGRSLRTAGVNVTTVELPGLPPKGDACDWLAAGGTAEALRGMARAAMNTAPAAMGAAFALVRASDMEMRDPVYIVDGMLETSTLALAFGDPGCGKSFLAIDIASSVATGHPFHGRDVMQGSVVYIAGEGHNGLKRRTVAWERSRDVTLEGAPLFFSKVAARFLDAEHAEMVAQAVDAVAAREGAPRLIVVDTLARNFGPGDENGTPDMSAFVGAIDALKARYEGCTALIIHHSGHAEKQRARGNLALKAALDTEYRVTLDGQTMAVNSTKMKDAPPLDPLTFTLTSVDLGMDRKGRPITSAVLELCGGRTARALRLSPGNRMALQSFLRAMMDAGHADCLREGLHVDDWRPVFYSMHSGNSVAVKKIAYQRARKALVANGDLSVSGDLYRLARMPAAQA